MDLNNDGGNGGGEAGSVIDLLGGGGEAANQGGDQSQQGASGGGEPASQGGDGGAAPDFLAQFSTETQDGESASMQDWVKASGVKDVAGLAKIARDNQRALRESGRIAVPGENATDAEKAEFRKAIGVPDDPSGYERPEFKDQDGNPIAYNTELTDRIFARAHEIGLPKSAAEELVRGEIEKQIEEFDAHTKQLQADAAKHVESWGENKQAMLDQVNAALKELGLSRQDVEHMRAIPSGVGKFLDAMAKVGSNFSEDSLVKGDTRTFGMKPDQAQAELNKMMADPDIAAKILVPGSEERAKYDRLNALAGQVVS